MRAFVTATKILFIVILPFVAYGFGTKVIDLAKSVTYSEQALWFAIGCAVFVPICWVCRRYLNHPWEYICTLEHELTHTIVGLPFLMVPSEIRVTATRGGHVKQFWVGPGWLAPLYGPGSLLSTLAPYFLPTVSYLLIAASFFMPKTPWFFVVFGFMTAFHVITNWSETRYRQPDIRKAGIIFSSIFLPVANLIAFGGLLAFITTDSRGLYQFWVDGLSRSFAMFLSAAHFAITFQ